MAGAELTPEQPATDPPAPARRGATRRAGGTPIVWSMRQQGRTGWEIRRGRHVAALLELHETQTVRRSLLARRVLDLMAAHHGEPTDDERGVDWDALGWASKQDHDAFVAHVAELVATCPPARVSQLTAYVRQQKTKFGVPARPPYSVAELDQLDRSVRRALDIISNTPGGTRHDRD